MDRYQINTIHYDTPSDAAIHEHRCDIPGYYNTEDEIRRHTEADTERINKMECTEVSEGQRKQYQEMLENRKNLETKLTEAQKDHPELFQAPDEPRQPSNEDIHGDAVPKATLQHADDKLPNETLEENIWFFPLSDDIRKEYDKLNERQKRYLKLIKIMRNKDDPPMEGITLEEEKKLAQLVFFHAGIKHISTFDLDPFCPPVLSGCVFGPEFLQLSTPEAIFMQPRSLPHDMLEEAMKQSREMIDSGQIVMGASSYNSNILMVPKPQLRGQTKPSLRLVIDYRALNSRTIKLNWPLLPTMEALDYMCGYSNYSASDCASGYHQIKVCPSIARCLAYSVGTWRLIPLKMPMGATNSMNCFMYCLSRAIGHLAQG